MGKCPSCGNKGWFLKIERCTICGKEGCDKCLSHLMTVSWCFFSAQHGEEILRVCSVQCRETFVKRVEEEIAPNVIDLDEHEIPVRKFIDLALRAHEHQMSEELSKALEDYPFKKARARKIGSDLFTRIERTGKIVRAETLKKVGRFEEAAKIYEQMRMYREAGKARAKGRQVSVRRTEISVDLNSLLKQIRHGGVVVVYRCPHCNAPIKIGKSTKVESLRVCEHYGSEIEPIDVADILRTALS